MKILVIDIGGTAIKVAFADGEGKISDLQEFETTAKRGGAHVMRKAIKIAHDYAEISDYQAIGISTTGQVDTNTGTIVYANQNVPEYSGTKVRDIFQKEFNLPTYVENDVNCAAIGETQFGAGKPFNDLLCITYGTGIGGAIVINRQIYGGTKGLAGEFGHIMTHPDGIICGCGQKGCYEQYASTTALVRNAMKYRKDLTSGRIIFKEWLAGDEKIKVIIDKWIDEITIGLVSLIHIFNPNAVILGGGILAEEYIQKEIDSKIYQKVMASYGDFKIIRAENKNTAGLLGASYLAKINAENQ